MKIYDCFTFYNELELLDIRFAEMYDHVDFFVIVEATTTFQNNIKPLFFEENKDRYKKYLDKVIHVVTTLPQDHNPWINETAQRNDILKGLIGADPTDLILISDVDEIIRGSVLDYIRQDPVDYYLFRMPYFNLRFNYLLINEPESYFIWATGCRRQFLNSPEELRLLRKQSMDYGYALRTNRLEVIEHSGWHFTYLGSADFIKNKIVNFSHMELNKNEVLDNINVEKSIQLGRGWNTVEHKQFVPVAFDSYFPTSASVYKDLTLQGEFPTVYNYLPTPKPQWQN
jgi:hypothetical protein